MILSPKDVGVPQTRKRAIILAVRQDIFNEEIIIKKEDITKENRNSIKDILIKKLSKDDMEKTKIDEDKIFILNC
ncbi:C-5 cytosine-specific DNA methylase family protein [Rickettsia bellii str. RML Mogi]|uniref:C-5 cytosine-specific DNA methylase family protein n=1 Tax=Rickettsia bellii str. RML Mogi TaxID=1359194 RepID=A0A0F3QHN1_RICBE|nr:C-5 cytosine-specific DNA methylase family protein [Rickettsia bellii str. RML Mogi]